MSNYLGTYIFHVYDTHWLSKKPLPNRPVMYMMTPPFHGASPHSQHRRRRCCHQWWLLHFLRLDACGSVFWKCVYSLRFVLLRSLIIITAAVSACTTVVLATISMPFHITCCHRHFRFLQLPRSHEQFHFISSNSPFYRLYHCQRRHHFRHTSLSQQRLPHPVATTTFAASGCHNHSNCRHLAHSCEQ